MESINNFKISFTTVTTSIIMGLGFLTEEFVRDQIKLLNSKTVYLLTLAVVSIIIVKISEKFISDKLFEFQWFRKLIVGENFLEGFWIYSHSDDSGNKSPHDSIFYNDALAEIKYDNRLKGLKMNVFRTASDKIPFRSDSNTVVFSEKDRKYINHFKYIANGVPKEGFASGYYTKRLESKVLSDYEGIIIVYGNNNEWISFPQKGSRISNEEINEFRKNYKKSGDWRREFLKQYSSSL